jgi:hypothetical protein
MALGVSGLLLLGCLADSQATEHEVVRIAAEELCPESPSRIEPELYAFRDSGAWLAEVRGKSDPEGRYALAFTVKLDESRVEPTSLAAADYLKELRTACGTGSPLP